VRYYLYISEAKLDMLGPQLPWYRRIRQRAGSLEWTLGARPPMASISVSGSRHVMPSVHARLLAVEGHILRSERVGDVHDGAPWIQSTMDMQFLALPGPGTPVMRRRSRQRPLRVLFWCEDEGRLVLLGGSARHLVDAAGVPREPDDLDGGSRVGWLLWARARLFAASHAPGAARRDAFDQRLVSTIGRNARRLRGEDEFGSAPTQRVTFLARRHVADSDGSVTLGTPLYVAVAEPSG
jgi:hypothetical protein